MNERISPITTSRDGNKITKVCVEDYYKMINRIARAEERSAEKWNEIWDSMGEDNTCLITGIGVSQPNMQDAFDEQIGNNIAFIKAKLNANMKKRNVLLKLWKAAMITINAIDEEIYKVDNLIAFDLDNMRTNYNPGYLPNLDGFGYEIQEEVEEPGSED
jgi:protein tyrosine phosphatase